MNDENPRIGIAYARYSSHNQREESIEEQLEVIDKYAKEHNIKIVKTYSDYAKSASKNLRKRKGFLQMFDDIENGEVEADCVVVYCLSRFMRDKIENAIYKKKLFENGMTLLSAIENLTDDAESVLYESLLEGLNQYYSLNLSREVRRGLHNNAKKGLFTGGKPPLGYKVVDKKLAVNEEERPVVEYIFNSFVEGKSLKKIADEVNAMGYRTRTGKLFKPNSFYDLLSNEKYIGTYVFNKTEISDFNDKRNSHKYKDDKDIIRIENCFEGIISKELFDKVQAIKQSRKYSSGRAKAKHNYLLTGLVFCGECEPRDDGKPYSCVGNSRKSRGKYKEYISYRCSNRRSGCVNKEIRKEYLEEYVLNELERTIFNEHTIKYIVKGMNRNFAKEMENVDKRVKLIDKQLEGVDRQVNNIIEAIKMGISDVSVKDELQELRNKRNNLEYEKSQQLKKGKVQISISESDIREMVGEFKDYVMNRNITECKQFIHKFVNKIMVYRDHIEVEYKFNLNFIDDDISYQEKKDISRNSIIEIYKERYSVNNVNDYLHQRVMETHPEQPLT